MLPQNEYTDRIDPVTPDERGSSSEALDAQTFGQVRRAIGQLTHLADGTRPDLASWIGDFPTRVSQLSNQDANAIKDLVKMAERTTGKLRYCIQNDVCLDKLHLVSLAYCAFGGEDAKGRSGCLLTLSDSFPSSSFHIYESFITSCGNN